MGGMGTGDRSDSPPRDRSLDELIDADPKFVVAFNKMMNHPELAKAFSHKVLGSGLQKIASNAFAGGWNSALKAEWERRFEERINAPSDLPDLMPGIRARRADEEPILLEKGSVHLANPVNPEAPTLADLAAGEDLTPFVGEVGPVTYYEESGYGDPPPPPQVGAPVFLNGKKVGVIKSVKTTSPIDFEVQLGQAPDNVVAGPGLRPVHIYTPESEGS